MLRFRDVTVRYPSSNGGAAVRRLTLSVGAGEVVALVGPSGAGKSTILGLAAGLLLPTEGTVDVLGVDTRAVGRRHNRPIRSRIGMIHQDFALVGPLRVAHNVAAGRLGRWGWWRAMRSMVRPVAEAEIVESLERVGISDKMWERTDRLSGGQQQRTAVARTLFQQPQLVLADEPCSALDPAWADAVMSVLVEGVRTGSDLETGDPPSRGRALLTSLHDAPLATRHCDRIVGLRAGLVEFDLPASEVSSDRLARLYEL